MKVEYYESNHMLIVISNDEFYLPSDLYGYSNIKKLFVKGPLLDLDQKIYSFTELELLSIEGGVFDVLPCGLSNLKNLKSLELKRIPFSSISAEIWELKELKHLILLECNVKEVPHEINNLTNLIRLDLSLNHISKFYGDFSRFSKLKKLFLQYSGIQVDDKIIKSLPSLKSLWLEKDYTVKLSSHLIEWV